MDLMSVWFGVCALASGGAIVAWPDRKRRAWQARLDALRAGAPERYFEELRTLEAYPVPASNGRVRFSGVVMLGVGAVLIGLGVTG